jgi:hypothetical protein
MTSRRRLGRVRRLPSGRWQARYPDGSGDDVPAPETFASTGDAARWLVMVEADMARGQYVDPRAGLRRVGEGVARSSREAGQLGRSGSSGPRRVHAAPRRPRLGFHHPDARPGCRRRAWPSLLPGNPRSRRRRRPGRLQRLRRCTPHGTVARTEGRPPEGSASGANAR